MRISVAMPTFNGARFLRAQLTDILSQTRPADEIIICDDGSTDGTADVLGQVVADHPLMTVRLASQNRGLRANLGEALSLCTGDVIVLADQDDRWAPTKLETVAAAFADPDLALWFSDADLIDEFDRPLPGTLFTQVGLDVSNDSDLQGSAGIRRLLLAMTVTGATMAVRNEVIRVALPLPVEQDHPSRLFLHDGWLALIGRLLGSVEVSPARLTRYRIHGAQFTQDATVRSLPIEYPRRGSRPSAAVLRDWAAAGLVAERLREHPEIAGRAGVREFLDLHGLLTVRAMAPTGRGRRLKVIRQLLNGSYHRHARGVRTALWDIR